MVCFQLAGEAATPLSQVLEILPYRPGSDIFQHGGPMAGLMTDRGRTIALCCLSRLTGGQAPARLDQACVLVVQAAGQWLGFVVPQLSGIENGTPAQALPPHALSAPSKLTQALRGHHMVHLGRGPDARLCRVLDLQSLAEALACPA